MKKVLTLWRRIHFAVFEFNKFTQINIFGFPVLFLLRNKYVKQAYQKRGVAEPEKIVRRVLIDPKQSTIIWLADVFMCTLIILLMLILSNFISALVGIVLFTSLSKMTFLLACLVPSLLINYFALWREDRYLKHFETFEKEPKEKRREWAWISAGVVAGIFLLVILSFATMTMALDKI